MKIQLKRSNVLDGGSAKEPTAAQMEYGEIAVNYNTADPTLFIKDSANAIVRINGNREEIENILSQIEVLPSPLTDPSFQAGTLDERYVSRFSWADLPELSTAP